jgi:hypothetical protein
MILSCAACIAYGIRSKSIARHPYRQSHRRRVNRRPAADRRIRIDEIFRLVGKRQARLGLRLDRLATQRAIREVEHDWAVRVPVQHTECVNDSNARIASISSKT